MAVAVAVAAAAQTAAAIAVGDPPSPRLLNAEPSRTDSSARATYHRFARAGLLCRWVLIHPKGVTSP